MSTDPELTSAQAADLVGLSRPFVKACIESGDLQTHRTAGPERLVVSAWS
jgi:excisionase family DNA binding protein